MWTTSLALLTASALVMVAIGIATPLTCLRLETLGLGSSQIGIALACHHVGFAVVALKGSRWCEAWSSRSTLTAVGWTLSASILMQAIDHCIAIALGRGLGGGAIAFACLAIEPILGQKAGRRRGVMLGAYLVTSNLSYGLGAAIAGSVSYALFVAAGAAALVSLPIWLSGPQKPPPDSSIISTSPQGHLPFLRFISISPRATLAAFGGGAATTVLLVMTPLEAARMNLDPSVTSQILMLIIFAGAFFPSPMGLLADRFDRNLILALTAGLGFVLSLGAALNLGFNSRYTCLILAAGMMFALYPLSVSLVQERVPPEAATQASGRLLLAYALGSFLGPPIAGILLDCIGESTIPLWVAASAALVVASPSSLGRPVTTTSGSFNTNTLPRFNTEARLATH